MKTLLNKLIEKLLDTAGSLGEAAYMVSDIFLLIFRKPDDMENIFKQMVRVGFDSLPIVILSSLFTGMVLALQSGVASNKMFGDAIFIGSMVAFSMVLELGPVLTGLVVAGRVGASITAEIGSMKVTEQIDALYTLGTTPEYYLGVPLFIATITMVPMITLLADVTGIWGGYLIAVKTFAVPGSVYMNDMLTYLELTHFIHGIIKSVFFAFIIVTVSCYMGFSTSGGAEGVGRSTTRAVVISMLLILVFDYFLSMILKSVGII